jgi:hypothetical protein
MDKSEGSLGCRGFAFGFGARGVGPGVAVCDEDGGTGARVGLRRR